MRLYIFMSIFASKKFPVVCCLSLSLLFPATFNPAQAQSPGLGAAGTAAVIAPTDGRMVLSLPRSLNLIYVSPNGNDDSGDGTAANPLRTLAKAFSLANAGDAVKMQPGTYLINETIVVPAGVNLEGSGASSIILPAPGFRQMMFDAASPPGQLGRQYFQNFTIDGRKQVPLGIRAWGRSFVVFNTIFARNFTNAALDIRGNSIEIANSRFVNASGREGTDAEDYSGAIRFANLDTGFIHDNVIEENLGGGLKGLGDTLRNLRIYRNTITLKGNSTTPQNTSAAIEINDAMGDNKIYNNTTNGRIVCGEQARADAAIPASGNLSFDSNTVFATPGVTDQTAAVDVSMKGAHFTNNYFNGFAKEIFNMQGTGKQVKNIVIAKNVLRNCGGAFGIAGNGADTVAYHNNTSVNCKGVKIGANSLPLDNLLVVNNLFINTPDRSEENLVSLLDDSNQFNNTIIGRNIAVNYQALTPTFNGNTQTLDAPVLLLSDTSIPQNAKFNVDSTGLKKFGFGRLLVDKGLNTIPYQFAYQGAGIDIGQAE
jgi:Protein of unknown function (DUF1565)